MSSRDSKRVKRQIGGDFKDRLSVWVASACLAGSILGAADVLTMITIYSGVVSMPLGAILLWAQSSGLFVLLALLAVPLLTVLDRHAARFAPPVTTWLAGIVLAITLTTATAVVTSLVDVSSLEFPEEVRLALHAGWAGAILLAILLFDPLRAFLVRRFLARLELPLRTGMLAAAAVCALVASHTLLAAIHQLNAAVILGGIAAGLMCAALAPLLRSSSKRQMAGIALIAGGVAIAGLHMPGDARDHARYMLYTHGAGTARLAQALRDLVDIDGDGSASTWLGGADCTEGDPGVGPGVKEIVGDGIDQDCRGGDAAPLQPLPPAGMPAHCHPPNEKLSVLLIVVDALRPDYVTPGLMPGLTELARASTTFGHAYSPTALTVTSFPSLLSAQALSDMLPTNVVTEDEFHVNATLPEQFARAGYRTAVFSHLENHEFSNRGFGSRNDYWHDRSLPNVKFDLTTATMARGVLDYWARNPEQPAFVLLHLSDVHAPYPAGLEENRKVNAREAYALGASYLDLHLQQLFARMQQQNVMGKTLIVVTSDHGEELAARGRHGHGHNTYEEGIRVPLIIWAPNCQQLAVSQPVSTRQTGPTLGALTGVGVPGMGLFEGQGLAVVTEGAMRSALHLKRTVVYERLKLVVDVPNGGRVLFDLERDPGEETNIYGVDRETTERMEFAYQRWLDSPGSR
jgi:arylsulfatase A-like enzyme